MTKELLQYLRGLQRRARRLVMGISVSYTIAAFVFSLIIGAISFSLHWPFEIAIGGMIFIAVALIFWSITWAAVQWNLQSTLQTQVDLAEEKEPKLRGRLYLVLDAQPSAHFLQERALKRALALSEELPAWMLHPWAPLQRALLRLGVVFLVGILAQLFLPIGPLQALGALNGKEKMQQELAKLVEIVDEETAVIGDITLEYTFPAYTKMQPVTVPNSDGSIHAPAGTLVTIRARSLQSYQSVSLQINKKEIIPVSLEFGRNIEAEVQLVEQGSYRFLLFDGEKQVPSPEYVMEFDDDDPPVVTAELKKNAVASNRALSISWSVIDDFGIERVLLEVEAKGEIRSYPIRKPESNQLELSSRLRRAAKEIGLKGGDEAILRIVAYDNQAPIDYSVNSEDGGPFGKRGESADMKIMILTPQMSADRLRELNKKLRDAMIPILADYLVEPLLPSPSSKGMVKWAGKARKRYDPLREITRSEWGEQWPTYLSAELVLEVLNESGRLIRYTMVTYGDGSPGKAKQQDATTFIEMHKDHVAQLERTIFIIDRMLRQVAFQHVGQDAKKLARKVERLTEQNIEDMTAAEIFAKLNPIDRLMTDLKRESAELSEGSLKEFIKNRSEESVNLEKELRKFIEAGDIEQARQLMEQLSDSLQQFSDGLQEQMDRMKQQEDELKDQMEDLLKDLEKIEQDQLSLADELSSAREREDESVQEMASLWKEALVLAQNSSERSDQILNLSGDGKGFRTDSLRQYDLFKIGNDSTLDAVQAKMLNDSLKRLYKSIRRTSAVQVRNETEKNRGRISTEPRPDELSNIISQVSTVSKNNAMLLEILQKIDDSNVSESVEMQQLAKQLSSEEDVLMERMGSAQEKVQEVEQQMPTADGSASEYAEDAQDNMGDAEDNLAKGQSMAGEGYQRNAAGKVRDTIEALQQQMQQMQQMQQQMQQMSEGGQENQGDHGGDGDDSQDSLSMDIPSPEDFMTPEEYRKLLLEGMTGEVPEEFQNLKKRYYEELVTQ